MNEGGGWAVRGGEGRAAEVSKCENFSHIRCQHCKEALNIAGSLQSIYVTDFISLFTIDLP